MPSVQNKVKKAVILAGGKGTRLYPITKEIPKPLLPVARKPILNYLVDLFLEYKIDKIALLINHQFKEEFEWWKKRYYPRSKIEFFDEKKPLGTFGGLYFLKDWIDGEHFFISNGDELKRIDLNQMINFHLSQKPVATLALVKVKDSHNYGVAVTKRNLILDFIEKPVDPPSRYINSGLYLCSPEIFDYHPGPRFLMIEKHIFPKLAKQNKLAGFKFGKGKWMDCGTWQRYEQAIKKWSKGKA